MKVVNQFDGIPGLDLGPYLRGEKGALEALGEALREISETIGFYFIDNHGIPQSLIDETFSASRRFHEMPLDRKLEIPINDDNVGYMGLNASMQRHSKVEKARKPNYNESFFVKRDRRPDDPDVIAKKPFRGLNQWPRDLPGFRETIVKYQNAVEALGMRMLPTSAMFTLMRVTCLLLSIKDDISFSNEPLAVAFPLLGFR